MNNNKLLFSLAVLMGLTATGVLAEEGSGKEPARTGEEIAQTCVACHGEKGISSTGMYPHLAGQHASYIVQALKDYKSGKRDNQIMQPMAAGLSEGDMEAVAEYYSGMEGLTTAPRKPGTN